MTLGERLRKIRRDKELSQKELGDRSGIHPVTICHLESRDEDRIYFRTVRLLAKGLGVSLDGLVNEENKD